jgi:CheY-like chemotaxis protein
MPQAPENLTVLVVDDDGAVLDVAAAVLAGEGYAVLRAESPTQALAVLQTKERIDLLFTDIVMPGEIDGFELAHRARQMRPELRTLYTSGHLKTTVARGDSGIFYGPLIAKPWRATTLADHVRKAFDA